LVKRSPRGTGEGGIRKPGEASGAGSLRDQDVGDGDFAGAEAVEEPTEVEAEHANDYSLARLGCPFAALSFVDISEQ